MVIPRYNFLFDVVTLPASFTHKKNFHKKICIVTATPLIQGTNLKTIIATRFSLSPCPLNLSLRLLRPLLLQEELLQP
jgi:hypothetical protein